MTDKVFVLLYGTSAGQVIIDVFAEPTLAQQRIVKDALDGQAILGAKIVEKSVLDTPVPPDPRNPLIYVDVVTALREHKKILAIKALRAHNPGMFLKEAKDIVDAITPTQLAEARPTVGDEPEWVSAVTEVVQDAAQRPVSPGLPFKYVESDSWNHFLKDDDEDLWAHVGDGRYRLLDRFGYPQYPDTEPHSYSFIEDNHGPLEGADYAGYWGDF